MTDPLLLGAATLGVVHTLLGPDHYLPFVVLARTRSWSWSRTALLVLGCGAAHVLASVLLGVGAVLLGSLVFRIEEIQALRGAVASWLLVGFGAAYASWGLRNAIRKRPHSHLHVHSDGTVHAHEHTHLREHAHVHGKGRFVPWVLLTVFVVGPCEPLVPLLVYPVASGAAAEALAVTVVFAVSTLGTMLAATSLALVFSRGLRASAVERYGDFVAGLVVLGCGLAMRFGA
ncbi:MAG: hypothetical protein KatS3mg076_1962 [Candidatus Binatia bacterium]|nr:MAG: hypothetical protein KatS3mg076_1962 [Candidatus Binatia bacterium]